MSNHLAVVTVEFPRPIKGSELIGSVKTLIGEGEGKSFVHEQHFDNGDVFVIGQYSGYPYDHILVAVSRESDGIRPDEIYTKVEVMDTSWPGSVYLVGYEYDAPIHAVCEFAEKLKSHFDDSSDTSETSIWPQEVKVCAICEKIVWRGGFEDFYCGTDGKNPPTKVVKVTLVVE